MKFFTKNTFYIAIATITLVIGLFAVLPSLPSVESAQETFVATVSAFAGGEDDGQGGCCGGEGGDQPSDPDPEPDAPDPVPTCTLSLSKTSLPAGGGSVTISWSSNNEATDSTLWVGNTKYENVGVNSGSKTVNITEDSTIRFDIWNNEGSDTCIKNVTVADPEPLPTCDYFKATPNSLPYGGGSVTLSWQTSNADSVSINNGVGSVADDGSKSVFVSSDKTFTLTVTNSRGSVNCATSVNVGDPEPYPTCDAFSATPNSLPYGGGQVRLSWNTTNADSVSINNGVGSVSADGSKYVTVTSDTTFTLTVTNSRGSVNCATSVNVGDPTPLPSCDSFTGSPASVPYNGGVVKLQWNTTNADSVSINNGVGSVSADGSKNVYVTNTKTFTLTATNVSGSKSCQVTITRAPQNAPTCDAFTATPNNLPYGGGQVRLSWSTTNANTVSINNGVGVVAKDGSKYVTVTNDRTYTLTATNSSGSVTCPVSITVADPEPLPSCDYFKATPSSLPYGGGTVSLQWMTSNADSVSINNGVGSVADDGTKSVFVSSDKTFTLTVTNARGSRSCITSVNVGDPEPYPTCDAFTATPNNLPYGGGTVTLNWNTTNADSVSINNGVGSVVADGNKSVLVTEDTNFTLTVTNSRGSRSCYASVNVGDPEPLPTCDAFTATPSALPYGGGNVTLSWNTTNADSVSINNGVGSVVADGNKIEFVDQSKTFTMTVTNSRGSVSCHAPVAVADPGVPVCTSFVASPNSFNNGTGGALTLTWDTENVRQVSIDNGVGIFSTEDGSVGTTFTGVATNAAITKTYTLTALGINGAQVTCNEVVTIYPAPSPELPSCDLFTASKTEVLPGGTSVLTWETTNADTVEIDRGEGFVVADGSKTVTLPSTEGSYTYTLTAKKAGEADTTCPVTITVKKPEVVTPSCDMFSASPTKVAPGGMSTLTWNTTNADSVEIDRGVGPVSDDGTKTVQLPTSEGSYTYTLTATKDSKSVSCPATVVVEKPVTTVFTCENNVSFSANDYELPRGGGDVTLTWNVSNADSVSINGVSSTNLSDSEKVEVNSDTTFTLTAKKAGFTDLKCPITIDVKTGGGGSSSPKCDMFKASDTKIRAGQRITLEWETSRGNELTIYEGSEKKGDEIYNTDDDDDVDEGSIKVRPLKDTTYTLVVERGSKDRTCDVDVEIENDVIVLSDRNQEPRVAGIALTSVPYTGFEAGTALTMLFYAVLTLWGLFVAYTLAVKGDSLLGFSFAGVLPRRKPVVEYATPAVVTAETEVAPVSEAAAYVAATATPAVEAPANLPVGTMSAIGYASTPVAEYAAPAMAATPVVDITTELENQAHANYVLLSSDAMRFIVEQNSTDTASDALRNLIKEAKKQFPTEDGWIVLNLERVQALTGAAVATAPVAETPMTGGSLAEAIIEGNIVAAYEMIAARPMIALADAAADLDTAYRARKGEAVVISDMLASGVATLSDAQLEAAIAALTGAIDGTYTDEASAVKMAIMKAVKAVS